MTDSLSVDSGNIASTNLADNTFQQLELLADISLKLIETKDFSSVINEVLKRIGDRIHVSRVYIFEDNEDGSKTSNTFEWCNQGVSPQIDNLKDVPYDAIGNWKQMLQNEGKIMTNDIHTLSQELQNILEPQGIKSILVIPLINEDKIFGFIGFDEIGSNRVWTGGEVYLLDVISTMISNAFIRHRINSALRQTAAELKQQKEFFDLVVDGTKIGIWDWDLITNKISVNNWWANILGYQLDELGETTIKTWELNCHPDDLLLSNQKITDYFSGLSEKYLCEVRMKHKDSHWVWVQDQGFITARDENNKPTRMIGIHQDISQRKQSESYILESEINFHAFFDSIGEAAFAVTIDGRIMYTNRTFQQMLGYNEELLYQMKYLDLFSIENQHAAHTVFEAMLNEQTHSETIMIKTRDGRNQQIEFRGWIGQWDNEPCILGLIRQV
jgi:PAS domain S-box-containing protein